MDGFEPEDLLKHKGKFKNTLTQGEMLFWWLGFPIILLLLGLIIGSWAERVKSREYNEREEEDRKYRKAREKEERIRLDVHPSDA